MEMNGGRIRKESRVRLEELKGKRKEKHITKGERKIINIQHCMEFDKRRSIVQHFQDPR
jgi:hypothetical protein